MSLLPYRCLSPECRESGDSDKLFYLDPSDKSQALCCPECSSSRPAHLIPLQVIHLLLPEKDGPVKGVDHDYTYCCDEARQSKRVKHATGEPEAATCRACLDYYESIQASKVGE